MYSKYITSYTFKVVKKVSHILTIFTVQYVDYIQLYLSSI